MAKQPAFLIYIGRWIDIDRYFASEHGWRKIFGQSKRKCLKRKIMVINDCSSKKNHTKEIETWYNKNYEKRRGGL
ncbi:hypothetical protein B6A27_18100 [Anoxybacillus sp. UARK-01]|nr:hypothetical protein B6A27_18100 [Anoxybacillus sp. UARK-01]